MQFPKAIEAIKCILGIPNMQKEKDNSFSIFINNKLLVNFFSRQSFLVINSPLISSIKKEKSSESLLKRLLENNATSLQSSNDVLSLNENDRTLYLTKKMKELSFSLDDLQIELDSFINNLENWNLIINNELNQAGLPLSSGINYPIFK